MAHELQISISDWREAQAEASRIREIVFVEEQGVPADLEMDSEDAVCRHALVRIENRRAIATGRLLPDGHIGRIAVLYDWRGKGIGREVVLALIAEARRLGHQYVALNSQVSAIPFYLKLGFLPYGDSFMEAGIPHQAMKLVLICD